jgi:ferric enterobactin receptor
MSKILVVLLLCTCYFNSSAQQITTDTLFTKKVDKYFCFKSADRELETLAATLQVKFNYNAERLAKYRLDNNFHNDDLKFILKEICKATNSKYFIGDDNVIFIVGRNEKLNSTVFTAMQKAEAIAYTRLVEEKPTKFNIAVAGKIIDMTTGEPLPGVSVMVVNQPNASVSNVDGYFTLFNVATDTAILEFSTVGYTVAKYFLTPKKSTDSIVVQMVNSQNSLAEVVVSTKKQQSFKLNQKISTIKLTPALIATLPSIGEKDIFRSFQLMPGVSAANENSSGLYVRGGTPDQTLVQFDGFTVYNVEHLFGFFSAFNSNAIKDVTLFKGGFESKYGGRLSSVVDINGKEGNKKQFNAGADLSLISINMFAEGPIGKKVTGIVNFRKSFRTSLYDKIFNKYSGETGTEASNTTNTRFGNSAQNTKSFFYDLNTKLTWKPTSTDVFSLSFYNGKDNLDNSITPQIPAFLQNSGINLGVSITDVTKWGNTGSSLKWSKRWSKKIFSNTLASFSNYFSNRDRSANIKTTDAQGKTTNVKRGTLEDNNLLDFSVKSDVEIKVNKHNTIETGFHITQYDIKYSYAQNDTSKIIDKASIGYTYTGYLQNKIQLLNNKLQIIPGLRTTYFNKTQLWYNEPRLNISYDVSNKIKLKTAYGHYYQFAKRVVREDILQGSRDFWVLADEDRLPVAASKQLVAGISWENNDVLVDVEAYHKKLTGVSEYSLRFQAAPGQVSYTENFFEGTGSAIGIDFLVQKKFGNYNGWVSYTLGEALNNFDVYGSNNFYAANDVRHEFKTVHMYKFKRFDFSATFILATGRPYTAPSGAYNVTMLDGSTQTFFNVSDKNANRLPTYHRLDLGATYNFGNPGTGNGTIALSLFNLYNRQNIWYKNFEVVNSTIITTNVNYLGFTPNLTFTYKFK